MKLSLLEVMIVVFGFGLCFAFVRAGDVLLGVLFLAGAIASINFCRGI